MEFNFNEQFEKMMRDNDATEVVILGHMNPDGDAAGSVMGLAHYIKANYPQYIPWPFLSDKLDKGPKKQVMEDTIFCPFERPKLHTERYAVIVCDTATLKRLIGMKYYQRAVISMVIDHHASNEGYGTINYKKVSESCAYNVYEILDDTMMRKAAMALHPNAADYLYMGILHDTSRFSRSDAGIESAGSKLLAMGADHRYVMRTMQDKTLDDLIRQGEILQRVKRVMNGRVAYIYMTHQEAEELQIGYEDIHPISGMLRDCEDIEMGFSMYEEEPDVWRCSFRSDGQWINVNEMMQTFGGGGHAAAAGLRKGTHEPEKLLESILEEIRKRVNNVIV